MKKFLATLSLLSLAFFLSAAGPTTQAVNSPAQSLANLTALAVDFHTATGDVATISIPSYVTAYQVTGFKFTNCSTTPIAASIGLFTGAGGTGTTVVSTALITTATSAAVVVSDTIASTNRLTSSSLFVRLTIANLLALTCDVHITIDDLS